jgi:hypothetical protein
MNSDFFSEITPVSAYWAGFIAADGHVKGRRLVIALSDKDDYHLQKFLQQSGCSESHSVKYYSTGYLKKDGTIAMSVRIWITNQKWIDDLEKYYSIVPNKTFELKPPKIFQYLDCDDSIIISFLSGFIDGDGCIRTYTTNRASNSKTLRISVTGASSDFLAWIKEFMDQRYPLKSSTSSISKSRLSYKTNSNITQNYCITGSRAVLFSKEVLSLNIPFLQRKWNIALNYINSLGDLKDCDRRKTVSHENAVQIRLDVFNGMSRKEASQKYGVTRGVVNRIVSGDRWKHIDDGLKIPKGKQHPLQMSDDKAIQVKALIDQGARNCDIARRLNVTPAMITGIKSGRTFKHLFKNK